MPKNANLTTANFHCQPPLKNAKFEFVDSENANLATLMGWPTSDRGRLKNRTELHTRHSGSVVSQTLRPITKNGITELSQTAPSIFCWAAIKLGISQYRSRF